MKWLPILLIFIIASCSTVKYIDREIPVPVETIKTEYINQYYRDSIFIHDSIDRFISGDTIYQYKYKYIYKYFNRVDTVFKTDSIEVPIEHKTTEIKEVNKLKWYLKAFMWFGIIGVVGLGLFIVRKYKK